MRNEVAFVLLAFTLIEVSPLPFPGLLIVISLPLLVRQPTSSKSGAVTRYSASVAENAAWRTVQI